MGIQLEENRKVNRVELVVLLSNAPGRMQREILLKSKELASKFNMKIEPLPLTEKGMTFYKSVVLSQ